jgi:hypothetical protein
MERKMITCIWGKLHSQRRKSQRHKKFVWMRGLLMIAAIVAGNIESFALQNATPKPTRRVLILLAQGASTTPAQALNRLKNDPDSLAAFFNSSSYGVQKMDGDVFGPYPSPAANAGCDTVAIANELIAAYQAAGHSIAGYHHQVFVLPSAPDCGWVGIADIGSPSNPAQRSFYKNFNPLLFVHEIGHNFGIHHPSMYDCGDVAYGQEANCSLISPAHPYHPLGGGFDDFTPVDKGALGWLGKCNIVDARRDAVFNLMPLDQACDGIQSVRVYTGNPDEYFYLEYRRNPEIFDVNAPNFHAPSPANSGVYFNVASSIFDSLNVPFVRALDMTPLTLGFQDGKLAVGQSYTSPNNVTFKVLSQTENMTQVQISFPGGGSSMNSCLDGTAPPVTTGGQIGLSSCGPATACAGIAHWRPATNYAAGTEVQNTGTKYQCKPYPHSGHCSQAGYEPGVGTAWSNAWNVTGTCPNACSNVPAWDPLKPWYTYTVGERKSRSGHVYSCHSTQWCYQDPAHPQHGSLGWTDLGECGSI